MSPFPRSTAFLAGLALAAAPVWASEGRLLSEGTEFVVALDDGRVFRGSALVGIQLVLLHEGRTVHARIDGVREDEKAVGGSVVLYSISVEDPSVGTRHDLCQPDPQGRRLGFPVQDGTGGFSFTCTSGVEGKCVLMGYRPWEAAPGGPPLRDLHRACVHMLRADYGGDNRPSTQDGTLVDLYDRFGIQKPDNEPGMTFEAAWGPKGTVCVARPRISGTVSLEDLAARYPTLAGRLGPVACTEEILRADPGALLGNRSDPNR